MNRTICITLSKFLNHLNHELILFICLFNLINHYHLLRRQFFIKRSIRSVLYTFRCNRRIVRTRALF
jgi:hypothetical protein